MISLIETQQQFTLGADVDAEADFEVITRAFEAAVQESIGTAGREQKIISISLETFEEFPGFNRPGILTLETHPV